MDYPEDPRWRELLEAAKQWRPCGGSGYVARLHAAIDAFDPPEPKTVDAPEFPSPEWGALWMVAKRARPHIKSTPHITALDGALSALAPKPKRHTFGGVVFEETGEFRSPRFGEWHLADDPQPFPCVWDVRDHVGNDPNIILRPVALEEDA